MALQSSASDFPVWVAYTWLSSAFWEGNCACAGEKIKSPKARKHTINVRMYFRLNDYVKASIISCRRKHIPDGSIFNVKKALSSCVQDWSTRKNYPNFAKMSIATIRMSI